MMILAHCEPKSLEWLCHTSLSLRQLIMDPQSPVRKPFIKHLYQTNTKNFRQRLAALYQLELITISESDGCELTLSYSYRLKFSDWLNRPKDVEEFLNALMVDSLNHPYVGILGPTLADFKFFRPDIDLSKFDPQRYRGQLGPMMHQSFVTAKWTDELSFIESKIHRIVWKTINELNDKDHDFSFRGVNDTLEYLVHLGLGSWGYSDITSLNHDTFRKIADKLVEASDKIEPTLRH